MTETNNEHKRIIEVGGVKVEVDLRTAKRVDTYKVGDPVKVLIKGYGETWTSHPGVIVGFADFKSLPSIEVLYLDGSHSGDRDIKLKTVHEKTEGVELAPFNEYETALDRIEVLAKIDGAIQSKEDDIRLLKTKRAAFEKWFGRLYGEAQED